VITSDSQLIYLSIGSLILEPGHAIARTDEHWSASSHFRL